MDELDDYSYLSKAFNAPVGYVLPEISEYKHDREKPEINSHTFAHELYFGEAQQIGFLPSFCLIDIIPKSEMFLLGTNDFNAGIVRSSVIATSNYEGILNKDAETADFIFPDEHSISSLKFLFANLLFVGNRNGEAILLSTHTNQKKPNESTPFYLTRSQVKGCPTAVEHLIKENELIVGTQCGHITKFRISSSLQLVCEKLQAHADEVTGISTVSSDMKYATCSRDRSCLLWDDRMLPPAKALLSQYNNQLTAIHWSRKTFNLILGDELGNLLTIDLRSPNKIYNKSQVSNREVSSIKPNNKNDLGIVTKSNRVKIAEICDNNDIKPIYEHSTKGIIYDMAWDISDMKTFYIVGENQLFEKLSYH